MQLFSDILETGACTGRPEYTPSASFEREKTLALRGVIVQAAVLLYLHSFTCKISQLFQSMCITTYRTSFDPGVGSAPKLLQVMVASVRLEAW